MPTTSKCRQTSKTCSPSDIIILSNLLKVQTSKRDSLSVLKTVREERKKDPTHWTIPYIHISLPLFFCFRVLFFFNFF